MTPVLLRRQEAARAAVARFKGKPHRIGSNDCARMAAFTLRKLGHSVQLPGAGSYSSLRGGLKVLKGMGHDGLVEALDAMLPRTHLALALPADIIGVPGEDGWTALWIALPGGRALGYHASSDVACILQPTLTDAIVWRTANG